MSHAQRDFRERLWWFDVVYPLTVAIILFTSLTYIVYSGRSSSRLSLLAEQNLLEFSLAKGRGRVPQSAAQVLAVSADPLDVRLLGRAPAGVVPDVSIAVYARVIEALANQGVKAIFVRLDGEAHPDDDVYFLPLTEALRRVKGLSRVYLVAPSSHHSRLPPELPSLATLLDDATCDEPEKIQSNCPYSPKWDDWVMPILVSEMMGGPQPEDAPFLTQLLPSISPAFILNLSSPRDLPLLTFRDVLRAPLAVVPLFAFIGGDETRALASADTYVKRFTRTVYDPPAVNVEVAGTPLHIFWEQVATMFLDKAMIRMPTQNYVLLATAGFCAVIIATMAVFGGTAATGMFMVFMMTGPFVNAWAVKHLFVYMPLFDCLYFGLSTFIFAGFARLSLTAFQRYRLEAQRRFHAKTADLKGNFISLLSHNLNTPVAKLQGMLGVLSALPPEAGSPGAWREPVREAEGHAARLEFAIRSILIASALEEGSLAPTPRTARALVDEWLKTHGSGLRRLGVRVTATEMPPPGDEDLLYVPLNFDVKAMIATLAAYAALFAVPGRETPLAAAYHVRDDDGVMSLVVTFAASGAFPDAAALAILECETPARIRSLGADRFFLDLLAGLGRLTREVYAGAIEVRGEGAARSLTVTFKQPPAGGTNVAN